MTEQKAKSKYEIRNNKRAKGKNQNAK